ncbi:MAG: hypothetical protein PHR53_02530 [Bacteroidales bacterium]|nr:hypothetical protein [Bacteroidales bacterium]
METTIKCRYCQYYQTGKATKEQPRGCFRCVKIRGKYDKEKNVFNEVFMKISKNRTACEFFEQADDLSNR